MRYGPLCQQFYDADKGFAGADEVGWYAERLPRGAGPVLEAMCGSGRLLLPLLREGFHVHGADDSAPMLAACEARLAGEGRATPLFRQDLAALNLPFRYGAAFVAAGSLLLLDGAAAIGRALARLRAHLVPPGLLLLDLCVPDLALHPPGAPLVEIRAVQRPDGSRITLHTQTSVDTAARRISYVNRYERRGGGLAPAREDETLQLTWLDEDEAVALVGAAGFAGVALLPAARPAGGRSYALRAVAARA